MVAGLSSGRALLWVAAATAAGGAGDRLRAGAAALVHAGAAGRDRGRAGRGDRRVRDRPRVPQAAQLARAGRGRREPARSRSAPCGCRTTAPTRGRAPRSRSAARCCSTLSALLACWPRGGDARGYPFLALVGLLVLVVSPVVSLGGTRPLLLGAAIAALTVCFLWLERLPLRPGLGVAALLGVALAGALPLAAVADRGEPWFDYKAFAEGLGPDDPVRFSWTQGYGPIDWPRDGNEVMRVTSDEPHYWKAANLSTLRRHRLERAGARPRTAATSRTSCARTGATSPAGRTGSRSPCGGCARSTCRRRARSWRSRTRRGRCARRACPGRWTASSELRRGDSYTAEVYDPAPTAGEVRQADRTGFRVARGDELQITVPFLPGREPTMRSVGRRRPTGGSTRRSCTSGRSATTPSSYVTYPQVRRTRYDAVDSTFRRSPYARTWELAKQLRSRPPRRRSSTSWPVNNYLQDGFGYSERPQPPAPGRRAARRLPVRHQGGLLPALLGRDGAAAADGRRAGAGGDRLQPRRLLEAPRRLDRARHRRARVGRGVVRRARLGDLRPDARLDAGALADRRARGGAAADPGLAERRRRGGRRRRRAAARRRCAPTCSSTRCATTPPTAPGAAGRRHRRGGCGRWPAVAASSSRSVLVRWLRARRRRGHAVTARPRGRRARGRAAPRGPPAAARHDAAPARAAPRRAARGRPPTCAP